MPSFWPLLALLALAAAVGVLLWWRKQSGAMQVQLNQLRQDNARLQETLQQQDTHHRDRLQELFNHMAEGIILLSPDGRIQLVNTSLTRLLACAHDVRGKTLLEAFRLHDLALLAERLTQEDTVIGHELSLPGLEARCLHVNGASLPTPDGRSRGALLVLHDLTPLKDLQNSRQEFVANVSHELRTPLSLIKGCVETLLDGAKQDPVFLLRFLQTIKKHTDRLTYLIEDLLTLSQLESGRTALNRRTTAFRELVARVFDDLEVRAGDRQVLFENLTAPEVIAEVDPERFSQVLFNLVDNAIKYGRIGGRIQVRGQRLPDGTLQIAVQDDGPGIPPEGRDRVFERFYRIDKGRSREQGGTGLGLAIVKHIVLLHGGKVWVESEPGRGATFCFTLPPDPATTRSPEPLPSTPSPLPPASPPVAL